MITIIMIDLNNLKFHKIWVSFPFNTCFKKFQENNIVLKRF